MKEKSDRIKGVIVEERKRWGNGKGDKKKIWFKSDDWVIEERGEKRKNKEIVKNGLKESKN